MSKVKRRNLRLIECRLYAVESRKDLAHRLSTKSNVVTVEQLDALAPDIGNFKLFPIKKTARNALFRSLSQAFSVFTRVFTNYCQELRFRNTFILLFAGDPISPTLMCMPWILL